ncbi:MAG: hypothetical protein RX318_11830 [bacterium]|nr:hypothetical protein [bacterium]
MKRIGYIAAQRIKSLKGQHIDWQTEDSDKTIRINSRTYTVAASIIGMQCKPRYGVNMTNNIYGAEFEPGCSTGSVFTGQGIIGVAARCRMKGGSLSGEVIAFEGKLEYGDLGKTVAKPAAVLRCDLSSKRTFTQGAFPIHVLPPGDNTNWTAFALIPTAGALASTGGTPGAVTGATGWIKVIIGTGASQTVRYIALASSVS